MLIVKKKSVLNHGIKHSSAYIFIIDENKFDLIYRKGVFLSVGRILKHKIKKGETNLFNID